MVGRVAVRKLVEWCFTATLMISGRRSFQTARSNRGRRRREDRMGRGAL